ncbi:orotidine-5'-phosphate decarboxylase [Burkholderiaceae bacterium UC74_6]
MSSPVIVSLDFESGDEALALVRLLGPAADAYKIGLQTLTEAGPSLVRELVRSGHQVFLDLKLHEIPNSVAGAVRAAGKLGASTVTVHASAGSAVLRAAVAAAKPFPQLRVLALTVITSLVDADLTEIGLAPSVEQQVLRLAALAGDAGCHGVIASANEVAPLRRLLPAQALIVCPGIQLPGSASTDQARLAGPRAAAEAGASQVVIGRAITAAADPVEAYRLALTEFLEGAAAYSRQ